VLEAGAGISTQSDARRAAEEAAAQALAGASRADAALLFATPHFASAMGEVLDVACRALGTSAVVGATTHGVLANGRDREDGPGLAIAALRGLEARPFLLPDVAGEEESVGHEIAARAGGPLRPEDLVVVLPDPGSVHLADLLAGLRAELPPAQVVGAGAAQATGAPSLQWSGEAVASGALSGIVLRAPRAARVGVTQACRPATELLTVTRARGNWILELDGRPALDVYREVARGPLADDLRRAAAFVLVAFPREEGAPLRPGGYLVRNVAGFALEDGALAVPHAVKSGQAVALALREPEGAREDLKAMLAGLGGDRPAVGLFFDCCARGASLFGMPGLEAAYLQQAFGDAPIAGCFGSCEIGPVGGETELLTYTGVLALLD